jgi:hypothetical protein
VSTLRNPTWQQPHQTPQIMFDAQKVVDRVRSAETPIGSRIREPQASADERVERKAITDACDAWLIMQNENHKWPDWE